MKYFLGEEPEWPFKQYNAPRYKAKTVTAWGRRKNSSTQARSPDLNSIENE